jgi:adenosine deaminase
MRYNIELERNPSMEPVLIESIPNLHCHLDGSLRRSTLEELAASKNKSIPENLLFYPGMGLDEALARFSFTLSLLQEPSAVRRVASEMCEDAENDGVATLEIRFAPQLHRGASIEAITDAALGGINGRAGLILCGLYGEPPDLLTHLVKTAQHRPGVVGIDLAGGPAPHHRYRMDDYASAFNLAMALGLGRTVHASEGRPPFEIKTAVETLHAQRIGHGTTLLKDPKVLDLVLNQNITIEACPTSNWHTGAIPSVHAHPLLDWLKRGVRVFVNPDNTLLSNVTAREEWQRISSIPGMTPAYLQQMITFGNQAAFKRQ